MKILALDSSAVSASAAVLDDDKVLGEFYGLVPRSEPDHRKWIYLLFLRGPALLRECALVWHV